MAAAAIPVAIALVEALPSLIKAVRDVFDALRALGLSPAEIRARLAEKESVLPGIVVFWDQYVAQRHPDDTAP